MIRGVRKKRGESQGRGRVMVSLLLLPLRLLSWLEGLHSGRTVMIGAVMIGGVMRGTRQSQYSCSGLRHVREYLRGDFGRETSLARQAG